MLYVGASTIAQNVGVPTIALADSKWFQHGRKRSHSSKKLLFHVKQIAFERRVIRMTWPARTVMVFE
jgi:hypothetical protein